MSDIIRIVTAVRIADGEDPAKVAREFRDAKIGAKVQNYIAHVAGPAIVEDLDLEVLDNESLTHVCKFYDEDECNVCRHASGYPLMKTQKVLAQLGGE